MALLALFAICTVLSAAITRWLQSNPWGRFLLLLSRWALVFGCFAYTVLFFTLYKPNAWLPIAMDSVRGFMRLNPIILGVLAGLLVGTALVQFFGGRK